MPITFQLETINPARAQRYLDSNLGSQRHHSDTWVVSLAEMIERGEFDGENGQTIKFAKIKGSEVLIDGQHRLRAIILAEKPVRIGVMRGLGEDAFKSQDFVRNRTVEHYYQIASQDHAKVASQVAKWLFNVEHGGSILGAKNKAVPGLIADWGMIAHPTLPQVIDKAGQFLTDFQKCGMGTKAHLAFCYYEWQKLDPVYAYEVCRYFATGEGDVSKTIRAARNFLIQEGNADRTKGLAGNIRLMKVITTLNATWNADREGRRNLSSTARLVSPYLSEFEKSATQRSDKRWKLNVPRAA